MKKTSSQIKEPGPSMRTRMIHGKNHSKAWEFSHHLVPPITASTTFRLESLQRGALGFVQFADEKGGTKQAPILIYDRLSEPNTMMLEEQLATLEGAEFALSFASGMSAIATTLLAVTRSGQKILAHSTLYGCTHSLITNWLPQKGIAADLFNLNSVAFAKKIKDPSVRVIYFESVSNPTLEIIDLEKIVKLVRIENKKRKVENQILVVVDNTFATPWGMRPLEWGADIVVESLTKNISGFGTEMGGAVMASKKFENLLKLARKDFGGIITPYAAWHILVFGVPTQPLRFEKQQETAQKISEFLLKHPRVEKVSYPGLQSSDQFKRAKKYLRTPEGKFAPGTMIGFVLKGDMRTCQRFVDDVAENCFAITLAVSLGLNKTLIEVPGFMTHSGMGEEQQHEAGIEPRLIRLSIGLEHTEDLLAELDWALSRV